jgi:hypothetical protein
VAEEISPHTEGISRRCLVVPIGNSEGIPDSGWTPQLSDEIVANGRRASVTAMEDIRAWEEELVKIEGRSRRRSAEMKGLAHKMRIPLL